MNKRLLLIYFCLLFQTGCITVNNKLVKENQYTPDKSLVAKYQKFAQHSEQSFQILVHSKIIIKNRSFSILENIEKIIDKNNNTEIRIVAFLPSGLTIYESIIKNDRIVHLKYQNSLKKIKINRWLPKLIKNYHLILTHPESKYLSSNKPIKDSSQLFFNNKKTSSLYQFLEEPSKLIKKSIRIHKRKILDISYANFFFTNENILLPNNINILLNKKEIQIHWQLKKYTRINREKHRNGT